MAMMCLTRKKLENVTFCRRCGCITFKHDNERYLCPLIREGVHSRIVSNKDVTGWDHMSDRDRRIAHTLQAVLSRNAEYEGCVRIRSRRRPGPGRQRIKKSRWHDCIYYFRETNGFDTEI
jgi:hypothetical protein